MKKHLKLIKILYRAWKLDYSVNCPTHHWQTVPVERGHSFHQDVMHTVGSYGKNRPNTEGAPQFLLSVEVHNLKLHAGAMVCPYFDLTGLAPDTQLIFIWGCLAVVHNHAVNPDKFFLVDFPVSTLVLAISTMCTGQVSQSCE
jgi:hypothetical protein